ncbi:hypothetical protein [Nocardia brasiliensis]|uniref:hypothetical protein n=1 Tax=Nocardia brasiliensis TaxID=37326 RepID=UPI003D8DC92B
MAQSRPPQVTDEQLGQVQTLDQLGKLLRQAMDHAGQSLRTLERAAAAVEGNRSVERVGLTRTVIGDMCNGRYITEPRLELALRVCDVPDRQMSRWRSAYHRAGGVPVRAPDPTAPAGGSAWVRMRRNQVALVAALVVILVGLIVWPRGNDPGTPTTAASGGRSATKTSTVSTASITSAVPTTSVARGSPPPLTIAAQTNIRVPCDAMVFDKTAAELGAPPSGDAEYRKWARQHGGVDAEAGIDHRVGRVQLSMIGTGASPVTITGVDVEIVDRRPGPQKGIVIKAACGGPTSGRLAEIDLDAAHPVVSSSAARRNWGMDVTPMEFPYRITDTEMELFLFMGEVRSTDTVSYRLHVSWTDGRRSGSEMVDDGGQPFRVATADPAAAWYQPIDSVLVPFK